MCSSRNTYLTQETSTIFNRGWGISQKIGSIQRSIASKRDYLTSKSQALIHSRSMKGDWVRRDMVMNYHEMSRWSTPCVSKRLIKWLQTYKPSPERPWNSCPAPTSIIKAVMSRLISWPRAETDVPRSRTPIYTKNSPFLLTLNYKSLRLNTSDSIIRNDSLLQKCFRLRDALCVLHWLVKNHAKPWMLGVYYSFQCRGQW